MRHYALIAAAVAAVMAACGRPAPSSGIEYEIMDTTARPGDNFFRYATGRWVERYPQKPEYPRWTTFTRLFDENTERVRSLIAGLSGERPEAGTTGRKIADLYALYTDSVRLAREGAAPLWPLLREIDALPSREALLALTCREHDDLLWSLGLGADDKRSTENAVWLWQGGLSLGDKDYYTQDDPELVRVRRAFETHGVNLLALAGADSASARRQMATVMELQTALARKSRSRVDLRDPESNYNKMAVGELSSLTGFDWDAYLKAYGYDATDTVIVGQPETLAEACRLVRETPLDDLKTLYKFLVVKGSAEWLDDRFADELFAFSRALTGQEEQQPRAKRATMAVNDLMGDAVGRLYVDRYFPESSKERMLDIVEGLRGALGRRIDAQEWMTDSTRALAREKLDSMRVKIGYPDEWDDLSGLAVDTSLSLLDNVRAISEFYWRLDRDKHYNRPVNPTEWHMTPQTVNAYYNPGTNEICFPAGILQPPFFDPEADLAVNYGAIGVVIGHEMTHGFDDQGRQYDPDGNLRQWWSDADVAAFQRPADAMAAYFDSLWVIPGSLRSNGRQCLGENLADHGGISVAFDALRHATAGHPLPVENGFTPEQRFFLSYARVWAGVATEEVLRRLTVVDVHSVMFLRVNGGVAQTDAWYEAFGVQPGDSLYVAPENRVRIW